MVVLAFLDREGRFYTFTEESGAVESTYEKFKKKYTSEHIKCLDLNGLTPISKIYYYEKNLEIDNLKIAELLAELSHEINNPLAIVMSSLKVLEKVLSKETLKNEDMISENILDIKNSIDRVRATMANARNLVDSPAESFQIRPLSEIIEDIKSQFFLLLNECNINFSVNIQKELENVHVNVMGTTLNQCLFNLINNAFYEVKNNKEKKVINISIQKKSDKDLVISVEDNGRGIPVALRESIFELNFSTKGNEGSGIGLHLVRKYAQLNCGSLSLDIGYTDGAKFDLVFPMGNVETIKKTVLIVDDEVDLLDLVKSLLQSDYSVLVSSSVNNAFNLLKNNNVDIIISDFSMPILSGYDFFKMARGIRPLVPFILFSACINDNVRIDFESETNVRLIEKPDIESLKKEINSFHQDKDKS